MKQWKSRSLVKNMFVAVQSCTYTYADQGLFSVYHDDNTVYQLYIRFDLVLKRRYRTHATAILKLIRSRGHWRSRVLHAIIRVGIFFFWLITRKTPLKSSRSFRRGGFFFPAYRLLIAFNSSNNRRCVVISHHCRINFIM